MNNTNSNRNATNISNLHIKRLALNEGKLSQGFGFHGQNRRTFANSQISDTNV
jgi:ribosomal protein L22